MPKQPVPFIEEVPDYEVRGDIMYITLGGDAVVAMPLRIYLLGKDKGDIAIAKYHAGKAGVVRLPRRRKE